MTENPPPIIVLPNNIAVREHRLSDSEAIAHHGNNRKLWMNLRDHWPLPYTTQAAEEYIKSIPLDPTNFQPTGPGVGTGASIVWEGPKVSTKYVITHEGAAIGVIGLNFNEDVKRRAAELGYWLGEEYWGKQITTMVVKAFVEWSFRTFEQLLRLEAFVFAWNLASIRVLQKAGFEYEGTQKCGAWKDGCCVDMVFYGRLRENIRDLVGLPQKGMAL